MDQPPATQRGRGQMDSHVEQDLWDELGLWDEQTPRFKQCVLHIGTEKTGTTSLQTFLGSNRAKLLDHGFYVPTSLSPYGILANHERLTTYALQDDKTKDDLRVKAGLHTPAEVVAHRESIAASMREEVKRLPPSHPPGETVLLLSNEHCQSRLVEPAEVMRLKTFLSEYVREVKVVVYLRPQHELAVSLYDQALKSGYADISVLPDFSGRTARWVTRTYFDYDDLLSRWSPVFGRQNIDVRIYAADEMANGSVVDDFITRLGVPIEAMTFDRNSNISMSAERQSALNAVNRLARTRNQPLTPELRNALIDTLQQSSRGPGLRPTRHEAEAFFHSFSLSNEAVRAAFLPTRDSLFNPDFTAYAEDVPAVSEVEALASTVLAQQQAINILKARPIRH